MINIRWNSPVLCRFLAVAAIGLVSLSGVSCSMLNKNQPTAAAPKSYHEYHVKAYKPTNPNNVRVKVSLQNQAVYVMEGDRPLLVTACNVGKPGKETPVGNWTIRRKQKNKRRVSQPSAGYPMGHWCEFRDAAYGIHAGWVHPAPRTLGCVRLHYNVAPKFFELVKVGTPLSIARTQPEDATIGRNIERPADPRLLPDFPPEIQNTDRVFNLYQGPIFES